MASIEDIKEVKKTLKDLNKRECKLPPKEKNIMEWDITELKAYIKEETKGMGVFKKLKFASELDKRIKNERKKQKKDLNRKE